MNNRLLFRSAAVLEILTGVAMIAAPIAVVTMLLGGELRDTGVAVTRVLGIALLSLGVAAWESKNQSVRAAQRHGLLIYNVGVALFLAIIGTAGTAGGKLLWPVAVLHALLGALMLWAILSRSDSS